MDAGIIAAIALGIGLATSSGFRVFVPMLVASIAAHFNIFPVQEGFEWLASWPAMLCFGTATIAELLAYYIPVVDNMLDAITTPLSVGAGTLLVTSVLPVDNDMLKWVTGFIIGGGIAATVQGGSILARLISTSTTGGLGNSVVATVEHIAAFVTSLLSLIIPFVVIAILILLVISILFIFRRRIFKRKRGNAA